MPGKAPVDAVGGTQDRGPWPDGVEEIVEGEQYDRPVELSDGSTQTVTVTVTRVDQIVREDGTETDGYAVAYQFDDPTLGGGA